MYSFLCIIISIYLFLDVDPTLSKKEMSREIFQQKNHVYLDEPEGIIQIAKDTMAFCLMCRMKIEECVRAEFESDSSDNDQTPTSSASLQMAIKKHVKRMKHRFNLYSKKDPGWVKLKSLGKDPLLKSLTMQIYENYYRCNICHCLKKNLKEDHFVTMSHLKSIIKFFDENIGIDILNQQNDNFELSELLVSYQAGLKPGPVSWRDERKNRPPGYAILKREPKTDRNSSRINPGGKLTGNPGENEKELNPNQNNGENSVEGPLAGADPVHVETEHGKVALNRKVPVNKSEKVKPASSNWRDREESSSREGKQNEISDKKKERVNIWHLGVRVVPMRAEVKTFHCK